MTSLNQNDGNASDIFIFTARDGISWQSFTIPNKVKMINFFIIGAGGGGGGGSQPTGAASSYYGGAGGGSGPTASLTMPVIYLPETVHLYLGTGGAGGARAATTGGSGTNGISSHISTKPENSSGLHYILAIGAGGGGSGGGTSVAVGGNASGQGVLYLRNSAVMFNSTAGQTGGDGALSTLTTSNHRQTLGVNIVTGGAGGGGCTGASAAGFAGGDITGAFRTQTIPGGSPEQNGTSGVWDWNFMYGTGGSGGGGSPNLTGTTGNGGNGAYGCGGGGGGSSRNAGLGAGGAGGRGGDAICIISVW